MIRSELDILLDRVADPILRGELKAHVDKLQSRRSFGLVFEGHLPERVRLPEQAIRRGAKVTLQDEEQAPTFEVLAVKGKKAAVRRIRNPDGTSLEPGEASEVTSETIPLDSLVVIADFGEAIYPGLRRLGSIDRGGDRSSHIVINGENHHVLQTLRFTHAGKIDCIYIDPPYNSGGSRDWKYDNNYVDENDSYRHSKWLAFMERRLKLARDLLKPDDSVLIVAVDENEVHRLGLLLQQTFAGNTIQMVTTVTNPRGKYRAGEFSRCDEYLFFVSIGVARVSGEPDEDYSEGTAVPWRTLRRSDITSARGTSKGGKNQFYPIYIDDTRRIAQIGPALEHSVDRSTAPKIKGCTAVFPIRDDGTEMNWGLTAESLSQLRDDGFVRVGKHTPNKPQTYEISYLTSGRIDDVRSGRAKVIGHDDSGAVIAHYQSNKVRMPVSTWTKPSHNAEVGGTNLLKAILGDRRFPYPKSLYAVEDAIGYYLKEKPNALVLDFFAGSGTTAHAVARLNHRDGGQRQSILVTNNEVSADEAESFRARGLRPSEPEWEAHGIYEYITRPRITAALTGRSPKGEPLVGDYRFTDEFPMADGFAENATFLKLTYLDPEDVELDLAFNAVAPLMWLRAGGRGRIIDERKDSSGMRKPFEWTERYGVLFETDRWRSFVDERPGSAVAAFVVTDSQATFAGIASELPRSMDLVRLYENYMTTFAFDQGY